MKFKIEEPKYGMILKVLADDEEISIHDLVAIANGMSDQLKLLGFEIEIGNKPRTT